MKLGKIIGRVTLAKSAPALEGARWLLVSPYSRDNFQRGTEPPPGVSREPSLVAYDALGANVGQSVGYIEGREAASPFDRPTPIDAITAILVDEVFYQPFEK